MGYVRETCPEMCISPWCTQEPDILFSQDYDLGQWGHRYEFYSIEDFAYWDALVAYDPEEGNAVAVLSQVIDLERDTEIIRQSGNS